MVLSSAEDLQKPVQMCHPAHHDWNFLERNASDEMQRCCEGVRNQISSQYILIWVTDSDVKDKILHYLNQCLKKKIHGHPTQKQIIREDNKKKQIFAFLCMFRWVFYWWTWPQLVVAASSFKLILQRFETGHFDQA